MKLSFPFCAAMLAAAVSAPMHNIASAQVRDPFGEPPMRKLCTADVPSLEALQAVSKRADQDTDGCVKAIKFYYAEEDSEPFRGVTDQDLRHLKGFHKLDTVWVLGRKITDVGAEHLAGVQSLRHLYISENPITNKGLRALTQLNQLETLDIAYTKIDDDGLAQLRCFPKLRKLSIESKLSDLGIPQIECLRELRELRVGSEAGPDEWTITDKSVPSLCKLVNLEALDIFDTEISKAGVAELKKALPKCRIKSWHTVNDKR